MGGISQTNDPKTLLLLRASHADMALKTSCCLAADAWDPSPSTKVRAQAWLLLQ